MVEPDSFQNRGQRYTSTGWRTFVRGAFRGSSGGDIVYPRGTQKTDKSSSPALKPKRSKNIVQVAVQAICAKTKTFWIRGFRRLFGHFLPWVGRPRQKTWRHSIQLRYSSRVSTSSSSG